MRWNAVTVGGTIAIGIIILAIGDMQEFNIVPPNITEPSSQTDLTMIPDNHVIEELKASNPGFTSLTLNWIAKDNGEVASYRVYQDKILLATAGRSARSYDISGLKADTWYEFYIEACDASGNCANDGPLIGVRTLSVREAAESVIDEIHNLVSAGVLDEKQGNALITKLAFIYMLDHDNAGTVLNQLQEFNGNVNALSSKGMLTPEESKSLTDATNEIIKNIKG